jgi:type IV pilus assembly protein PilC
MEYSYTAKNSTGDIVEGKEEAGDKFQLAEMLSERDLSLLSANDSKGGFLQQLKTKANSFGTVPKKDRILFGKNLGSMLDAGLPLSRAIAVMRRQTKNKKFKMILGDVNESIRKGDTFSGALERHPRTFSNLFISMVRAGEESGDLVQALKVVSTQMEETHKLVKKVRGAMIYPGVIITAMVGIGGFLFVFVVPTLTSTFVELGVELPASTQFIITISDLLKNHTFLLLGGIVAFIVSLIVGMKTTKGKRIIAWIILHLPVIGVIAKQTNAARTTRTLSSLLASGVSYLDSVGITQEVLQNPFYIDALEDAKTQVELGKPIAEVFEKHQNLYPIFVSEMVSVGEETGDLGGMLLKVAVYYEDEINEKTKNLSTIIEPILMVVIGAGVGFFAVSMISPMYSLMENV